ncbi:MAG: AzlC family ABC transporter permease [Acetivibrio sp.]
MNTYIKGAKDGIPIALGYLSVSFTFGLMAVTSGLNWWQATIISITNLTSAGQFAGIGIITAGGAYIEMFMTQFVINLRYALMSLSLSQKVDDSISGIYRWMIGFGNTDEIFAVAMNNEKNVGRTYMFGLITTPYIGWAAGTFLGSVLGNVLPEGVCSALGIAIYGMFLAIIVPVMEEKKSFRYIVLVAIALSCGFQWLPGLNKVSSGFAIIICAVAASFLGALFFPITEEED